MLATLYLNAQRVRVVAGRYKAKHSRKFGTKQGSSLAEHRAMRAGAVSGKCGSGLRSLTWRGFSALPAARHRGCAFGDLDGGGTADFIVVSAIRRDTEIWMNRSQKSGNAST